jgi:hypothetical protein
MATYTDIGSVPGAWRSSNIASAASSAIASTDSYTPSDGSSAPNKNPSFSNSNGSRSVFVTPGNQSKYEQLVSESARVSSRLAAGTATSSEVRSYNARVNAFGNAYPGIG